MTVVSIIIINNGLVMSDITLKGMISQTLKDIEVFAINIDGGCMHSLIKYITATNYNRVYVQ